MISGVDTAALTFALGAGTLAALNPCAFAILPTYLATFTATDSTASGFAAVVRALRATAALSLGFAGVFLAFGLAVLPVAASVQAYLPAFTVVLGATLALAGVWLAFGRELPRVRLPGRRSTARRVLTSSFPVMVGFGASYAVASLACTFAPFFAVVVTSFRGGETVAGIVLFLAYAAGMGLTVGVAAVAIALARRSLVISMRRLSSVVPRLGGGVLALAGAYVAWYGFWEWRVLHASVVDDPLVAAGTEVQGWLSGRIEQLGALGLTITLLTLFALGLALRQRRS
ncbi:MAG TPA: cytochrome c biogenesis protein CcdA [Nocardioidaceae bacterium]|nr:cytochrome c biogenesis protein CcdA [Nocardioidaceae bacterium]